MAGLTSPTEKKTSRVEDEPDYGETTALSPRLHHISPRMTYRVGHHLSFSIDNDAVQLAAASKFGPRSRLLDIRKVYIPSELSSTEERLDYVTNTISDYVNEFGGRWQTLSLAVSGTETAFRTFLMPWLSKKELSLAVRHKAGKQIPFPIDDCEYDYRRIQKISDGDCQQAEIAIVAATRRLVNDALIPFDRLGLDVSHVYHSQDVIGRLLPALDGFREKNGYALINIGRHATEISYYRGSQLEFFHVSTVGSSLLANRSDPTTFEYFGELLASEIQNSLDYYTGRFSTQFTSQILVYGDLSYTEELIELLRDRFGFAFRRFPAEELHLSGGIDPRFQDSLSVCLPVLASTMCNAELANLLPKNRQLSRKIHRVDRTAFISLAMLLVFLSLGWYVERSHVDRANAQLAHLTQNVEDIRNSSAFHIYNVLKQQIAIDQSYLNSIKETPSFLGLNLKELTRLTPASIRLYSLRYDIKQPERNFDISGVVTHSRIPPEVILAEYVENLKSSPFYENVAVTRHSKRRVGRNSELEFGISARGII